MNIEHVSSKSKTRLIGLIVVWLVAFALNGVGIFGMGALLIFSGQNEADTNITKNITSIENYPPSLYAFYGCFGCVVLASVIIGVFGRNYRPVVPFISSAFFAIHTKTAVFLRCLSPLIGAGLVLVLVVLVGQLIYITT